MVESTPENNMGGTASEQAVGAGAASGAEPSSLPPAQVDPNLRGDVQGTQTGAYLRKRINEE